MTLSSRDIAKGRLFSDLYIITEDHVVHHWNPATRTSKPWKTARSLTECRNLIPTRKVNIGRMHGDSQDIVEVWI